LAKPLNISFDNNKALPILYGEQNKNITHLEKKLNLKIGVRGNVLAIAGDFEASHKAKNILENLYKKAVKGYAVGAEEIDDELRFVNKDSGSANADLASADGGEITIRTRKKILSPRSPMQKLYLQELMKRDLTIATGPAGTGKTYLAVAAAVHMFLERQVERIILSRPAVEAGEKIGFLPGDMAAKLDPYLRPLYDALFDMLPQDHITKLMENGEIEIAPLGFMRGRTLSNSFIILDESQNTTPTQMKMFLTRLGMGSRMAITGDMSQMDLPKNARSGLADAIAKLDKIDEIKIIHFTQKDVVRHPLAAKVVDAYEKNEDNETEEKEKDSWL
jgi:phosphate starvation-inducible PhoH-like protein